MVITKLLFYYEINGASPILQCSRISSTYINAASGDVNVFVLKLMDLYMRFPYFSHFLYQYYYMKNAYIWKAHLLF